MEWLALHSCAPLRVLRTCSCSLKCTAPVLCPPFLCSPMLELQSLLSAVCLTLLSMLFFTFALHLTYPCITLSRFHLLCLFNMIALLRSTMLLLMLLPYALLSCAHPCLPTELAFCFLLLGSCFLCFLSPLPCPCSTHAITLSLCHLAFSWPFSDA